MLDPCMTVPFGIHFVFCHKYLGVFLQVHIKNIRVCLTAGVENTNSSVGFGFPSVTFLKYWGNKSISPFIWNAIFSVYVV